MAESASNINDAVDVRELEEKLFSYSEAKNLLLKTGELIDPDEFASFGKKRFAYLGIGLVVGGSVGAALGFLITRRVLETKYNQIAEEEILLMREHYQSKMVALENTVGKGKLEDIVEEQGYSAQTAPPMAVSPPTAVVEAAEEVQEEASNVVATPATEKPAEEVIRNVFEEAAASNSEWDYHKELARRSPVRPYVIHLDERDGGYDEVSLTYYDVDDVLCNELDEVIGDSDRDRIVGEANLERFGHGSNDPNIVYIRNDKLEAQYEIVKSDSSYAEEVHGFEHADTRRHRRERMSFDDE